MFALDRIFTANVGGRSFRMPAKFNAHDFFSGIYGARVYPDMKAETVTIKADAMQANYFRSLPLNPSQEEIETTGEYSVFKYFLTPDYDFTQDILSFGKSVEIITPESLRLEFKKIVNEIKKLYD